MLQDKSDKKQTFDLAGIKVGKEVAAIAQKLGRHSAKSSAIKVTAA